MRRDAVISLLLLASFLQEDISNKIPKRVNTIFFILISFNNLNSNG